MKRLLGRWFKRVRAVNFDVLTKGNTCVIIVDMQKNFLKRISREERRKIINGQREVISFCIENDIPIIVLEFINYGKTIRKLRNLLFSVPRTKFITKKGDNGFIGTDLNRQLRSWNIENIFLMGINASACVRRTGEGALGEGYSIITSSDLIADPPGWSGNKSQDWYLANGLLVELTELHV